MVERPIENGIGLTILPIGASITRGVNSSDGNGYRDRLRKLLQKSGNAVEYVGTVHSGSMYNNAVQAVPGQTIVMVSDYADKTDVWKFQPNVILLNAGTNNCNAKYGNRQAAPKEYTTLLNKLRRRWPHAVIVASSLIPNLDPKVDACIVDLNKKLYDAVLAANGTGKMAWADMYDAVPWHFINPHDKTHPNDAGYQVMAQKWYDTLSQVAPHVWRQDMSDSATPEAVSLSPSIATAVSKASIASANAARSSTGVTLGALHSSSGPRAIAPCALMVAASFFSTLL